MDTRSNIIKTRSSNYDLILKRHKIGIEEAIKYLELLVCHKEPEWLRLDDVNGVFDERPIPLEKISWEENLSSNLNIETSFLFVNLVVIEEYTALKIIIVNPINFVILDCLELNTNNLNLDALRGALKIGFPSKFTAFANEIKAVFV